MNALVVGLVLAAAGSTEVEGAVTAGGQLRQFQAASVSAGVHGRLDVARDFGRFFVTGRASVLITGASLGVGLRDLGSRITLGYRPLGFVERLCLEVIPFNAAIRLPSFDWANAWGDLPFASTTSTLAPMLTAQVDTKAGALWLSGRFKSVLNGRTQFNEVLPELILGLEVPLSSGFRLEARGAWLNYGLSPALASVGVDLPLFGGGGGARLSWTWNEPVGPAVDLVTYANDPLRFERFFTSEARRTPFAAWVALEGGAAAQQLADPERFGAGKPEAMGWADLQVRLRLRDVRLFGTVRLQSVTFFRFDFPGIIPGTALASSTQAAPGVTGYLGADWTIRPLRLTPGLLFKLTQYGSVAFRQGMPGGNNPPPGGDSARVLMLGPNGAFAILGPEKTVAPLLAVKASARWEVLSFASIVTELEFEKDFNDYTVNQVEPSLPPPLQSSLLRVNGQLYLQARF